MKRQIFYFFLTSILLCTSCKNNDGQIIEQIVEKQNESCPLFTDSCTRLDSCAYRSHENTICYYYTLLKIPLVADTLKVRRERMESAFTQMIKNSEKLKPFKHRDVTFDYQYASEEKKHLFTIRISPDEYNED